jgi:hypothetical protein
MIIALMIKWCGHQKSVLSDLPERRESPWIKLLKLRWQLAARVCLHVPLMHLKREASQEYSSHWSLVIRPLLRRVYPGLKQLEKHRH